MCDAAARRGVPRCRASAARRAGCLRVRLGRLAVSRLRLERLQAGTRLGEIVPQAKDEIVLLGVGECLEDRLTIAVLHDTSAPSAMCRITVGLLGEAQVVGDHDEGHPRIAIEVAELRHDLRFGLFVEIGGRLVGEQQGRLVDEGAGDGRAPLLSGRQLGRVGIEVRGEAEPRQQIGGLLRRSRRRRCGGRAAPAMRHCR